MKFTLPFNSPLDEAVTHLVNQTNKVEGEDGFPDEHLQ